jgi:hypothetical protein
MENQENKFYQEIYDCLLEKKKGKIRGKRINYIMAGIILLVAINTLLIYLSLWFLSAFCFILIVFILSFINSVPLGKIPEPTEEEIKLEARRILEVRDKELQELKKSIPEYEKDIVSLKNLIN